jgi:hypothetical protein
VSEQSQMAIGMSDRKQSFREAEELKVVEIENSVPEAREMGSVMKKAVSDPMDKVHNEIQGINTA